MATIDELAQRFNQQMPPVNPQAFSGRQQQRQMPQGQMPPQGGQQGFDPRSQEQMQEYLLRKVEEIRRRLRQGDVGALENFTGTMRDMRRRKAPQTPKSY